MVNINVVILFLDIYLTPWENEFPMAKLAYGCTSASCIGPKKLINLHFLLPWTYSTLRAHDQGLIFMSSFLVLALNKFNSSYAKHTERNPSRLDPPHLAVNAIVSFCSSFFVQGLRQNQSSQKQLCHSQTIKQRNTNDTIT